MNRLESNSNTAHPLSLPSTPRSDFSHESDSYSIDSSLGKVFTVLQEDHTTLNNLIDPSAPKSLSAYMNQVEKVWSQFVDNTKLPTDLKNHSDLVIVELFDESGLGSILFENFLAKKG